MKLNGYEYEICEVCGDLTLVSESVNGLCKDCAAANNAEEHSDYRVVNGSCIPAVVIDFDGIVYADGFKEIFSDKERANIIHAASAFIDYSYLRWLEKREDWEAYSSAYSDEMKWALNRVDVNKARKDPNYTWNW